MCPWFYTANTAGVNSLATTVILRPVIAKYDFRLFWVIRFNIHSYRSGTNTHDKKTLITDTTDLHRTLVGHQNVPKYVTVSETLDCFAITLRRPNKTLFILVSMPQHCRSPLIALGLGLGFRVAMAYFKFNIKANWEHVWIERFIVKQRHRGQNTTNPCTVCVQTQLKYSVGSQMSLFFGGMEHFYLFNFIYLRLVFVLRLCQIRNLFSDRKTIWYTHRYHCRNWVI